MTLVLEAVRKEVGAEIHIRDVSLTLERGSLNVLLGATLAGKTSLMRLMAGLDVPTKRPRAGRRHGRHRLARAAPQRRHGLSAIHQLPVPQRLREHRLAAARRRPSPRRDREARERSGEAFEARALSRPQAAEPLRRSAAAHGHRARPRQAGRPRASRRAPRQSRLQAARGAARGTAAHLRRLGRDLRLRDDGAAGGAAARRQHGDPRPRAP